MCSLVYVKNGTFYLLWKLENIDFSYNNIIEFPENFGLASDSINKLNMWRSLEIHVSNLAPFYFRNFSKLTHLNLGRTDVTPFDPRILPISLTSIILNYVSSLRTFPNFTGRTPNLQHISIVACNIQEIPPENIQNMNIISLNIGRNRLTSIPDYDAYPYIANLGINNNRLTTIPDFYNTTLTKLSLSDNPLVCDNALCWIRMRPWFFDSPILTDTPICASPAIVTGTPLMEVRPVHMECFKGKPINRQQSYWVRHVCGKRVHLRLYNKTTWSTIKRRYSICKDHTVTCNEMCWSCENPNYLLLSCKVDIHSCSKVMGFIFQMHIWSIDHQYFEASF